MGGRAAFKKGQKVLVPHTDRNYLALVLKAQKRDDGHYYLIHYPGWSAKYDEWVEEVGLLKFDASLLPPEEQGDGTGASALAAVMAAASSEGGAGSGEASGAPGAGGGVAAPASVPGGAGKVAGGGGGSKKRKSEAATAAVGGGGGEAAGAGGAAAPPDSGAMPLQLRLHMPPLLKKVVLDDHDQVTHRYHVQPLPRRPSVRDILVAYEQERAREGGADAATAEVVAGLLSYLDQGLRQLLLYHQELQLHDEAVAGGKAACDVYGGEHLVRLLVKLPELVPVATMGGQNVVTLEARLHELMALLERRQAEFFLPSDAYVPNPHVQPPLPLPVLPPAPSLPAPAAAAAAAATPAPAPPAVPSQA